MKLKTMAVATGMALSATAVTGTAHADALATSVLDITNFVITRGGAQLDASDFSALVAGNTADVSASLSGTTNSDTISGVGQDLDLTEVSVGPVVPGYASNSFAVYTNPPQSTFSLADQAQFGSPITGLVVDGTPVASPGSASHAAYVSLDSPGDGSSTANNGLNTSFEFVPTVDGALDFTFDARAYLEAFTDPAAAIPTSASSEFGLVFTIEDLSGGHGGGLIVNWEPDGVSSAGDTSAFGLTAESDPFDLNDAISRNAPFNTPVAFRGNALGSAFTGSWSGTTLDLLAGNQYQLTIRSTSLADAVQGEGQEVPEPGTLALIGLGILGLGLSRRRRA